MIRFLDSLESGGMLADLYDYWPPPTDPEYPWTIADTSVVNMSVIFWALATALTDRARRGEPVAFALDEPFVEPTDIEPALSARLVVAPNPASGACVLSFVSADEGPVSLAIYDAGGRLVCRLEPTARGSGTRVAVWDGRDAGGRKMPSGAYFVRLWAGTREATARVIRIGADTAPH